MFAKKVCKDTYGVFFLVCSKARRLKEFWGTFRTFEDFRSKIGSLKFQNFLFSIGTFEELKLKRK
jgi:hypothetical protein